MWRTFQRRVRSPDAFQADGGILGPLVGHRGAFLRLQQHLFHAHIQYHMDECRHEDLLVRPQFVMRNTTVRRGTDFCFFSALFLSGVLELRGVVVRTHTHTPLQNQGIADAMILTGREKETTEGLVSKGGERWPTYTLLPFRLVFRPVRRMRSNHETEGAAAAALCCARSCSHTAWDVGPRGPPTLCLGTLRFGECFVLSKQL